MAAISPIAVANSASAMPGATTASEVLFEAAIDWKLDMMPQTVPNRPTTGPSQPLALAGDRDVHHLPRPHLHAGKGACLAFERALPFAHGRDETRRHRLRRFGRQRAIERLDRLTGPERR